MVAETNIEGYVRLPNELLKPSSSKHFLLRVRVNSMNLAEVDGDRIEDGDLVLVRRQPTASNGDVIVALIEGEATIKEFSKAPGYFVLKEMPSCSSCPCMFPQSLDSHELSELLRDA